MQSMTKAALTVVHVLIASLVPALAQPSPVKFDNYPRYGVAPPAEYRASMQPIVDDVLRAIKSGGQAEVRIVGHADFDAHGPAFETQVSQERASVAQQTLLAMIGAQAGLEGIGQDLLWQNLKMTVEGIGTREPVVPNPQNEQDRRKNRRVEISWTAREPAPHPRPEPRPAPEPIPLSYKVVGFGIWNGAAKVTLVGDQVVRFKVTNSNPLLGTTITIEHDPRGARQSRQIPPLGTVEIEFSMLTHKPLEWHFDISSESDAFLVSWSAMSFAPDN